jgi:hypothetical protein
MNRLIFAGLAIWMAQLSASAQGSNTCMSPAQVERDRCTRQAADDNVASGQCLERYLTEMERCSKTAFSRDPAAPPVQADPATEPGINR